MSFVAVYGHVALDHILLVKRLPQAEVTTPVEQTLVRLGGTAGNIARALAALGVPVSLAGFVGTDFPPEHRQGLERAGIGLEDLRTLEGGTPKVWILSVPNGPQSAIIDQGVMGDNVVRPPLDVAWVGAEWVHFTTGSPTEWLQAAVAAKAAGKRVGFDPAQEIKYRYSSRVLEEFLDVSDLFFSNETELEKSLELLGYGDAEQLLDHVPRAIITRGSKGSTYYSEDERVDVPACPVRGGRPVESTGAGDVFRAGVYAGLRRGWDWPQAVRAGAVASSLFLESMGQRFPDAQAWQKRMVEWRA